MQRRKILEYVLAGLMVLAAVGAWWSVDRAVNIQAASSWLVPTLWFSLMFMVLFLQVIISQSAVIWWSSLAVAFGASLLFAFSGMHVLWVIVGGLLVVWGCRKAKVLIDSSIKLNIAGAARAGALMVTLGLSIVITSEYYVLIKSNPSGRVIPKVQVGNLARAVVTPVLTHFSPQRGKEGQDVTVDELLLMLQQNGMKQFELPSFDETQVNALVGGEASPKIPASQQAAVDRLMAESQAQALEQANQAVLAEGRKKLGELAGREVTGMEKVADVFADIVTHKVNDYFSPGMAKGQDVSSLTFVLTFIVFATVLSIGSFLDFFLVHLTHLAFFLLTKGGAVRVAKVMKEVEVIE
ncbi:hypothetical protein EPO05_05685 [Patescibacteria group bacterium]|nr:MAG: hypothetical protein EPO05_05685 [Patescibacteria group bacterium]